MAGASRMPIPEHRHGAQGVEHVQARDRLGRPDGGEIDVLVPRQQEAHLCVDGSPARPRSRSRRATSGPIPGRLRTRHPARAGRRGRWAAGRVRGALRVTLLGAGTSGEGTRRERRTGAARGRRRGRVRGVATPDAGACAPGRFGLVPPTGVSTPVSRRPEQAAVPILGRSGAARVPVVQAAQSRSWAGPRRQGYPRTRPPCADSWTTGLACAVRSRWRSGPIVRDDPCFDARPP